ncbi:Protein of unknown function [Cotesia congregata]|uniref:Uncharacterized protein n=1 Tax=Cotesia congregata TaxID=51543 RepID=A0A8J2H4V6_COTCN|nr:Protein of unknown function [Cotesia congregata]
MNVQDIEDTGNQLIVTIKDNKNHYPRSFIIGKEYHGIVKKYTDLRPKDIDTRRFFINYQMGKCTCQVIANILTLFSYKSINHKLKNIYCMGMKVDTCALN